MKIRQWFWRVFDFDNAEQEYFRRKNCVECMKKAVDREIDSYLKKY